MESEPQTQRLYPFLYNQLIQKKIELKKDQNQNNPQMNPSSLDIDLSAVHSQKDMYKWFDSELTEDEGSPSTLENIISARQQVTSC